MAIYKGFSTVSSQSQKKFVLNDQELIKQDLLNVFNTRRGSRVMQPKIGCIVWEKLFEIIGPTDVEEISVNISDIIKNDPRIKLDSIDVVQKNNGILISLNITYTQTNQVDYMNILFNSVSETVGSF